MDSIRYNLFNLASYELSHSAFWGWILQCAEEEAASQHPGPHRVGCRFLEKAGLGKVASPVSVEREVRLPGLRDRLDIRFSDAKGHVLAVETKVSAIPDVDQANRYLLALGTAGRLVLLSSAFDLDVRTRLPRGCTYVGLEEMETLLGPDAGSHPLLSDYSAWLADRRGERVRLAELALSSDESCRSVALATPEGQWSLMKALGAALRSSGSYYRSKNLSGVPWTQLCFCEGDERKHDAIFYRVDRSARGDYLSVRQYQAEPFPSVAAKLARLETLRAWWTEACSRSPSLAPQQPRPRGKKESEIGWFLLSQNVPSVLFRELPRVHRAFAAHLRDAGWPGLA